jgi:hypothetical protein
VSEKKEPQGRTKTIKNGTQGNEEVDRRRAQKALDASNTLLAVAIIIFTLGYWLPNAFFGAQPAATPISLLVWGVYFALLLTTIAIDVGFTRSRIAAKRIATGLALMVIGFISLIAIHSFPMEWQPTAILVFLVSLITGLSLFLIGSYRAHQTLRRMAGMYTARPGSQIWAGTHIAFEVKNYHFLLAAGFLGAFLLFLSSIFTDNAIYAVSGFFYLITLVIVAAIVKTH